MSLSFTKYVGSGNDFIVIDHRDPFFSLECPNTIEKLCSRQRGVGADGLIALEKSDQADYRMRIFNCDGKEASMCGNGLRCLGHYIFEQKLAENLVTIEVNEKLYKVQKNNSDTFSITLPKIEIIKRHQKITIDEFNIDYTFVDSGAPHVVIFVENIETFPFDLIAPKIRHHAHFKEGTNVNIAQSIDQSTIVSRTFEKGVEGETLSCGTGAVAIALAATDNQNTAFSLTIIPKSQEPLTVTKDPATHNLLLQGNAYKVFQGDISLCL